MQTRHEKIIRKSDGSRVKITISISGRYREFKYITEVMYCPYKKRKWLDIVDYNSFEYRKLDHEERVKLIERARLDHVSEDEILETKTELWNMLKPEPS